MTTNAEAEAAASGLNGHELGGRALTVNEAKPKPAFAGAGGGAGGGGGRRTRREPRW
jgi:hypothetical protein